MCILEKLYGYLNSWKANTNLLWEQEYRRICKCGPFVKYDATKIDLINSNFKSELEELQNG
jgi:NAD(P)H-flavin reductase